ncbi:MAG: hypothetical protein IPH79_06245 [Sphingomonadales bacterium]|nr:hypothetical protein [Sphingomonadales bacterium]
MLFLSFSLLQWLWLLARALKKPPLKPLKALKPLLTQLLKVQTLLPTPLAGAEAATGEAAAAGAEAAEAGKDAAAAAGEAAAKAGDAAAAAGDAAKEATK